jgi:hypothetical protein
MPRWNGKNDFSSDYRDDALGPMPRGLSHEVDLRLPYCLPTIAEDMARKVPRGLTEGVIAPKRPSSRDESHEGFRRMEHSLLDRRHLRKAGD